MGISQIFSFQFLTPIIILSIDTWNHLALALSHLRFAFELLLYSAFSFSSSSYPQKHFYSTNSVDIIEISHHDSGTADTCAVCLSDVTSGDEIGALRYRHVFHRRCLENWFRVSKVVTCPLCRSSMARPRDESGSQVLFFNFCSFGSNDNDDDGDSWWLR